MKKWTCKKIRTNSREDAIFFKLWIQKSIYGAALRNKKSQKKSTETISLSDRKSIRYLFRKFRRSFQTGRLPG